MLKMVDGTGIIGVDMVCPLGATVSPPQPPNYDNIEMEGVGSLVLPNSLKAPIERVELIGTSVQGENPAPDNPQEIKSAGRKSKNLFNIADLRVGQVQKDGTINEKSTYCRTAILDVPQDGKYRITFAENNDYNMLYFAEMYTNGVYSQPYVRVYAGNSNSLIALKKGENILSFNTYNDNMQIDFTTDHNIMIAAESETLDYEPYGYLLDVKVTGKNLFDREKARDITNWIVRDGDGYAKFPIRVGKGNKVTFSYMEKPTAGKGFYLGITQSEMSPISAWLYHNVEISLSNNKFTVVATEDYIYLACTKIGIQKFADTIQTLQVEIGSEQTPYKPYTEQTVQIALDEPLRGIVDYKDTITKDGVVRKILEAPIAEYLQNAIYGNPGEKYISSSVPKCYINYDKNKCMSNIGFASNAENKKYIPIPKLESFLIKVSDDDTVETIKEKMKDVIVTYTINEPTTEPLPESVQAQFAALHSENGTTHVFVESGEVPCGIKLTYRKEK